jgi:hypothetical protein
MEIKYQRIPVGFEINDNSPPEVQHLGSVRKEKPGRLRPPPESYSLRGIRRSQRDPKRY